MEGKTLARIGAAAFAGIAIAAAAIDMTRDEKPAVPVTVEVSTAPADPMREALVRCRFMGEAATRDPECLRTWDQNRRRFLGTGTRSTERSPETSITQDVIGKESVPVLMPSAEAR